MNKLKKIIIVALMIILFFSGYIVFANNTIDVGSNLGKAITEYALWESEQREQDDSFLLRGAEDSQQQKDIQTAANKLNEIAKKHGVDPNEFRVDAQISNGIIWRGASNDTTNATEKVVSQAAKDYDNSGGEVTDNAPTVEDKISQKQKEKSEIETLINKGLGSLTDAELKALNQKLIDYFNKYNVSPTDEMRLSWADMVANEMSKRNIGDPTAKDVYDEDQREITETEEQNQEDIDDGKYSSGNTGKLGSSNASATHTPDEVITEAQDFINAGKNSGIDTIVGDNLRKGSSSLYNILMVIAIFLAVAIGMFLGVKFMLSSAEDKAKVKEALIPYIAGCVVIFSAFVIWKLIIVLLGGLNSAV